MTSVLAAALSNSTNSESNNGSDEGNSYEPGTSSKDDCNLDNDQDQANLEKEILVGQLGKGDGKQLPKGRESGSLIRSDANTELSLLGCPNNQEDVEKTLMDCESIEVQPDFSITEAPLSENNSASCITTVDVGKLESSAVTCNKMNQLSKSVVALSFKTLKPISGEEIRLSECGDREISPQQRISWRQRRKKLHRIRMQMAARRNLKQLPLCGSPKKRFRFCRKSIRECNEIFTLKESPVISLMTEETFTLKKSPEISLTTEETFTLKKSPEISLTTEEIFTLKKSPEVSLAPETSKEVEKKDNVGYKNESDDVSTSPVLLKKTDDTRKVYKCPFCFICYLEPQRMISHLRIHIGARRGSTSTVSTNQNSVRQDKQQRNVKGKSNQAKSKIFKCQVCDCLFPGKRNLRVHMMIHTDGKQRPFKCSDCCCAFPTLSSMRAHEKRNHSGKFSKLFSAEEPNPNVNECYLCKETCESPQQLQIHIIQHKKKERRFKCSKCNCYFGTLKELLDHSHLHRQEESSAEIDSSFKEELNKSFGTLPKMKRCSVDLTRLDLEKTLKEHGLKFKSASDFHNCHHGHLES